MRIIIDAYNVIRTNPEGSLIEEQQGNQQARNWLLSRCRDAVQNGEDWVVVFDGDGSPSAEELNGGSISVRYAHPHTADEVIRELGETALALHAAARIVSSDSEVRVMGCEQQDSSSFLDFVIKRKHKKPKPKTPSKTALADGVIKTLQAQGSIPLQLHLSYQLKDGLVQLISYLHSTKQKPQKMAPRIEEYLREHLPIKPSPDPQKKVLRAIKHVLE